MQISAYSKNAEITTEDLYELISDEIPQSANLSDVEARDFTGLRTEFEYKNHFWRHWILSKRNVLLYVTYNCEFEESGVERETIEQIVNSLKLQTSDFGQ